MGSIFTLSFRVGLAQFSFSATSLANCHIAWHNDDGTQSGSKILNLANDGDGNLLDLREMKVMELIRASTIARQQWLDSLTEM